MKKAISLLLTLAMLLTLSTAALAAEPGPKVTPYKVGWPVATAEAQAPANQALTYRYTPDNFRFRGNSTPLIFVLGDTAWTEQSANEALVRGGFDRMAEDESGHILFVSPANGKTWTKDDYTVMQALATNVTDDYFQYDEKQGLYNEGVNDAGLLYAGRFRSYTFAEGAAQAFVKEYLDAPDATYTVAQWGSLVDGFGAGFHYADTFTKDANLIAWETLRRSNRLNMTNGVTYLERYSVYADYGIEETRNVFSPTDAQTFEYLQYIPKSVDVTSTTQKYPLVLVFHGNGQNIDGYMHLMDWPVVGDKHGFITVGVSAPGQPGGLGHPSNESVLELVDALSAKYPIDTTRIYSTGYSMGGMKSWELGMKNPECFAAIAPTEAIPGMVPGAEAPVVPALKIPTLFIAGEDEIFPMLPSNSPAAIDLIKAFSQANGFDYNGKFDESLDQYYGLKADRTYAYNRAPGTHDGAGVWTIHELDDENGVPVTLLTSVSQLGHSAWMPSAERIWNYFSHFSRGADGGSVYTVTPYADVPAKSWYTSAAAHVYDNGLMTGTDGLFAPVAPLTADALFAALYTLAGTPEAETAADWARANALPTGAAALTRGQTVGAIYTFAKVMGADLSASSDLSAFSDGASASAEMRWAVGTGLINGRSGGKLDAEAIASRAEGAVMLQRLNLFLTN